MFPLRCWWPEKHFTKIQNCIYILFLFRHMPGNAEKYLCGDYRNSPTHLGVRRPSRNFSGIVRRRRQKSTAHPDPLPPFFLKKDLFLIPRERRPETVQQLVSSASAKAYGFNYNPAHTPRMSFSGLLVQAVITPLLCTAPAPSLKTH